MSTLSVFDPPSVHGPAPIFDAPELVSPPRPRPLEQTRTAALEVALGEAIAETGWLGRALEHHFAEPGGRARATMALQASEALGLDAEVGVALAVACELLHNASLVLDDLQDRDPNRRGRPAVWREFGEATAINVGTYLLTRAYDTVAAAPLVPARSAAVLRAFTRATSCVIRGQVADNAVSFEGTPDLERYETIARTKTGPLLALPCVAALAAAGAPDTLLDATTTAFLELALVYQIQDDLADLFGTKGRARGSDLRAKRPNIVATLHRARVDARFDQTLEEARRLAASQPERLETLIGRLARSSSTEAALDHAERVLARAAFAGDDLPPAVEPVFQRMLETLAVRVDGMRGRLGGRGDATTVEVEHRPRQQPIHVYVPASATAVVHS